MTESDYDEFDDDDLLAIADKSKQHFADNDFDESPRPHKRLKLQQKDSEFLQISDSFAQDRNDLVLTELSSASDEDDAFDPAPHPLSSTPRTLNRIAVAKSHEKNDSAISLNGSVRKPNGFGKPSPVKVASNDEISEDRRPTSLSSPSKARGATHVSPRKSCTGVGRVAKGGHTNGKVFSGSEDDAFDTPALPVIDKCRTGRLVEVGDAGTKGAAADAKMDFDDLPSDAFDSSSPQKDDAILVSSQQGPVARRTTLAAPQGSFRQTTLFGLNGGQPVPPSQVNKRLNFVKPARDEPPTHHTLNWDELSTWIYPINIGTIRDYQFNIVQRGLFHNLLVALPTGLGKTFIAATIMLNWYRWTKDAQIVFVAPTKPLVSQQVQACFGIAGIPRSATTMLTGGVSPGLRAEEWQSKRVFFMTPQTMINDLKTGICDPKRLVLLVVDEAHKATGGYAYAEIAKFVRRFNESFRVLALTATPGADVEAVQAVIDSLDISRVEIRTEQSIDIRQYVHSRQIDKHVFENTDEMTMCMELYSLAVKPVLSKLNGMNAYWVQDPLAITPFGMNKAIGTWFGSPAGQKANWGIKSVVKNAGATLASLAHSMDLLKYHGMGPFLTGLTSFQKKMTEDGGTYRKQICNDENFQKLVIRLKAWVDNPEFIGHPKLEFLQQRIMTHFLDCGEGKLSDGQAPSQTRVMIFAHWRDSAEDIVRILKRSEPMIRPHVFVGQAASTNTEGMSQKRQLEIIHNFKTGVYNTLVATSIGEEGLDIGEIDLIICYDSKASPIRMLQRMGRTGRKRAGRIILLQMSGKEEDDANKAKDNYEKMQEMIAKGDRFTFHDDLNRRILPKSVQPVVDKQRVEIPPENSQADFLPEPKKRAGRQPKRPPKKFHMPDNVITGFMTAARMEGGLAASRDEDSDTPVEVVPVEVAEPLAIIPSLSEVVLTPTEQAQLDTRYLSVGDNDDEVSMPQFDKHPVRQRRPFKSHAFKQPGKAAQAFVGLMNRMHNVDLDKAQRMAELAERERDQEDLSNLDIVVSDDEASIVSKESAPKPKAKPRAKPKPKPKPESPTPEPPAAVTTLIDDDDLPSSLPDLPALLTRPNLSAPRGRPKKTTTSTTSAAKAATKLTTPKTAPKPKPAPKTTTPKSKPTPKPKATKSGKATPRPRGRPPGRPPNRPAISNFIDDGLGAIEGRSSPVPATDPRMRIRSQAISLGDEDTSGEEAVDFDEEPDSELAAFVVGSDEEVEVEAGNSSLVGTFEDVDDGSPVVRRGRLAKKKRAVEVIASSDAEEDVRVSEEHDDEEEVVPVQRRQRRIVDSDEEE